MDEISITSLKASFIRTQARHLDTPLEPPRLTEEKSLSDKLVTDLVSKVNEKIRQHNRLIFSTQSQRHVAEQIESLHWNLVSEETEQAEIDTVAIRRDAELTDSETIRALPEEYGDVYLHPDYEAQEDEARQYTQMRQELWGLNEKRDVLKRRLAQYQHLTKLMQPLSEPQKNVQPNLVTRDGELSQELDRMRVLLARVTGRIGETHNAQVGKSRVHESEEMMLQTDQQKLARVMELG